MTDPRNYESFEYVRRGEALDSTSLWALGIVIAVLIGLLVLVSYSDTANNNTNTASNNAPNAMINSPPRIPPSTPGSGAQLEQPPQSNSGGFGR